MTGEIVLSSIKRIRVEEYEILSDKFNLKLNPLSVDLFVDEQVDENMVDTLKNIDNLNGKSIPRKEWGQRFEWFLYHLFKHAGYKVEKVSRVGESDDKIDLIVEKGDARIAIQAKNYRLDGSNSVSVDVVQSFSGSIENRKDITAGAVITSHFFTEPAIEWCTKKIGIDNKQVELIDRERLYLLIAKLYPELLSKVYFENDIKNMPKCSACGSIRIKKSYRENEETKEKEFGFGCVRFPKCPSGLLWIKESEFNKT